MDPNANLQEQLELAAEILAMEDEWEGDLSVRQQDAMSIKAVRLAELVLALHKWLVKGGFPPSSWDNHQDQNEQ